jgi:hypothetical protein
MDFIDGLHRTGGGVSRTRVTRKRRENSLPQRFSIEQAVLLAGGIQPGVIEEVLGTAQAGPVTGEERWRRNSMRLSARRSWSRRAISPVDADQDPQGRLDEDGARCPSGDISSTRSRQRSGAAHRHQLVRLCDPEVPANNDAILNPTGDGYFVGFNDTITDMDIMSFVETLSTRLNQQNLAVRICINKGLCTLYRDLNDKLNLCGWGIIDTQRVMSLGGRNHILCTESLSRAII